MRSDSETRLEIPDIGQVSFRKSAVARRVSIRVHPLKGVTVTMPSRLPVEEGLRFLMLKKKWVHDTMRRQRERLEQAEEGGRAVQTLGDGSVVRTLLSEIVFIGDGEAGRITVRKSVVEDVKLTGRLYLSLERPLVRKEVHYPLSLTSGQGTGADRSAVSGHAAAAAAGQAQLLDALVRILRAEAASLLPARLAFLAERYGFRYGKVTVRHNVSNWGSCSSRGNLSLNLNLVRLPEPLCDYVLLHELSHLRHHDHGPRFHDLLERLCADNLARLSALGDPAVRELLKSVRASRSARPFSHVLEREIKRYRPV